MSDPLMNFLQNGSGGVKEAVPVNYKLRIQEPVQQNGFNFNMLNPIEWLKAQIQTNPQMGQVMNVVDQYGGDAKTAFYEECKKRGQNPDAILQQVKSNPFFSKFFK